jgi:FAD binding domain
MAVTWRKSMMPGMSASTFRSPRTPLVPPGGMELHERDMTATFAAEVTLAAAQARLAEIGQWLAIDGEPQATLGELVSFNSTGPLRLGFGAWRDVLLGVQFTNGRGELISAGGQTVKNVAGYDLTKFIVGSAGIFGTIVTLTMRTYRRPVAAMLATYPADVKIVGRRVPTALRPQWAILRSEELLCGFLGDERTINYYRSALPQSEPIEVRQRSVDEDIADRGRLWRAEGELTFRASVPPMQIAEFAADLDCQAWAADAAFGVVLGSNITEDKVAVIRDSATHLGGSVRFISRTDGSRPRIDFSTNAIERQIIEKLKHAFDPDGKLNPLPWQSR